DNSFFSPLSPTSFATLAIPQFNYAGNLWAWSPQVRLEHRFAVFGDQNISIQGGILDNLTGEFPANSYFRVPNSGEITRQPAYALRTAWTRTLFGQPLTIGVAGYYSRQDWETCASAQANPPTCSPIHSHYVDGWAGMADWEIPLAQRVLFTGEFYRGKAVGGIGGGVNQRVGLHCGPKNA